MGVAGIKLMGSILRRFCINRLRMSEFSRDAKVTEIKVDYSGMLIWNWNSVYPLLCARGFREMTSEIMDLGSISDVGACFENNYPRRT